MCCINKAWIWIFFSYPFTHSCKFSTCWHLYVSPFCIPKSHPSNIHPVSSPFKSNRSKQQLALFASAAPWWCCARDYTCRCEHCSLKHVTATLVLCMPSKHKHPIVLGIGYYSINSPPPPLLWSLVKAATVHLNTEQEVRLSIPDVEDFSGFFSRLNILLELAEMMLIETHGKTVISSPTSTYIWIW